VETDIQIFVSMVIEFNYCGSLGAIVPPKLNWKLGWQLMISKEVAHGEFGQ
jgi:hypothetical protein